MCTWIRRRILLHPKKKQRPTVRKMTIGLYMLRCKEMGLTIDELENMDYGLVEDMLTEKGNDQYEYPYKASQEDFNKF